MRKAVARRYADALFHVALEHDKIDEVAADLGALAECYSKDPDFRQLLEHRRLSPRRKKELVRLLWEGRISRLVLGFLELLIDKRRVRYLEEIYAVYVALLRAARNIAVAEVKTPYPLAPDVQARLVEVLERLTRKKIELQVQVEPELLGGLYVKVGDRVYNGTVRKRLELLGAYLLERPLGSREVSSG